MNIHVVQKNINNLNLKDFIESSYNEKADLVCFGELSTSGCLYQPRGVKPIDKIFDEINHPVGVAVMFGCPIKVDSNLYNTYRSIDPG